MNLRTKSLIVTIHQMKAFKQHFPVVLMFIVLHKVVQTFDSVDKIV